MAHQPHRPFESLEWYRDAVRNDFRDDGRDGALGRWARGFGMLHAHICVFAAGIVTLLLANIARSPGNIWADKWIMAWTVLVLIHAVGVGILWALGQWSQDTPDEPLQMAFASRATQAPMIEWGAPDRSGEAQDAEFRDSQAAAPQGTVGPAWGGWNAAPETATADTERVSWKQASAAAWLDRSATESPSSNGATDKPSDT
jgi:hypothetical protein